MNRNFALLGLIVISALSFAPLVGASDWHFSFNLYGNPYYYPSYVVYTAPVAFVPIYPVYTPVVYSYPVYTYYSYPSYIDYGYAYPRYGYGYPDYISYN